MQEDKPMCMNSKEAPNWQSKVKTGIIIGLRALRVKSFE